MNEAKSKNTTATPKDPIYRMAVRIIKTAKVENDYGLLTNEQAEQLLTECSRQAFVVGYRKALKNRRKAK